MDHQLHFVTQGTDAVPLADLDNLVERVALEQLAHELNPVDRDGYIVRFHVRRDDRSVAAVGHFYVRPATAVAPAGSRGNSPS